MFNLPDLNTCVAQARAAFQSALPGANAWLWPNNVGPIAKVIGGAQWLVNQRIEFIGKQAFAQFATGAYLDRQGAEFNLPRKAAEAAGGNLTVTTSDAVVVAAGAQFARGDGVIFTSSTAVTSAGAAALSVPVTGPAGAASNSAAATPMTILSGVTGAGASSAVVVVDSNGLAGGVDIEPDGAPQTRDLSTYRGRILFRKAYPPQGGAPADYVQWASSVSGVTRVFVERLYAGPGTVRIFPIFDDLFAQYGGVPDDAHVAAVSNVVQALAPAAAQVLVQAPTPTPIAIIVRNLSPNTPTTQAAVRAELADAFRRLGRVSGNDGIYANMPFLAYPYTFLALWVEQAVANATGVIGADVVLADTPIGDGSMPVLGSVDFA